MDYGEPQFFHLTRYAKETEGDVIDMISGNPDFASPLSLRAALREYADFDQSRFQSPPSEGLDALRLAIAERRGVDIEQVVITNGSTEANYLGMSIAFERDAGDEAVLLDPVYPYYPATVRMVGGTPVMVPTAPTGDVDLDAIEAAITDETALVVLNTPNNPTGAVYDFDTVRAVIEVAERHNAIVLVDEVYDRFDYTGRFQSALAVDSAHRIVTSGFSKSMSITGFRVGFVIVPPQYSDNARVRHMLLNDTGSRPAQYAVYRALEETPEEYYADTRRMLQERIAAFTDALDRAGATYMTPESSFYVLARFDGFPGTMANVKRLIDEAGVAGMPGDSFGSAFADWIRFALVTPRALEAPDRLAAYFG